MLFSKKRLLYFILAFLFIFGVFYYINSRESSPDDTNGKSNVEPSSLQQSSDNGVKSEDAPDGSSADAKAIERKKNLDKLQELLDDEEKTEEALTLAIDMASLDFEQKMSAIEALNWIGGHKAKMTLIKLLGAGGDVSERAAHSLVHQFQDDAMDSEKDFDEEAFFASIELLDTADKEALLIVLDAFPVKECAPILIKLMDSHDEEVRTLAFEHFESMAEGTEFTSKAEAEKWFEKYLAENKDVDNKDNEEED